MFPDLVESLQMEEVIATYSKGNVAFVVPIFLYVPYLTIM